MTGRPFRLGCLRGDRRLDLRRRLEHRLDRRCRSLRPQTDRAVTHVPLWLGLGRRGLRLGLGLGRLRLGPGLRGRCVIRSARARATVGRATEAQPGRCRRRGLGLRRRSRLGLRRRSRLGLRRRSRLGLYRRSGLRLRGCRLTPGAAVRRATETQPGRRRRRGLGLCRRSGLRLGLGLCRRRRLRLRCRRGLRRCGRRLPAGTAVRRAAETQARRRRLGLLDEPLDGRRVASFFGSRGCHTARFLALYLVALATATQPHRHPSLTPRSERVDSRPRTAVCRASRLGAPARCSTPSTSPLPSPRRPVHHSRCSRSSTPRARSSSP